MIINPEIMITQKLYPTDVKILDELEHSEKVIFSQKSSFNGEIKVVENRLGRFLKLEDSYQAAKIYHPSYKGNIPYVNYFFLAAAMKREIKSILILGLGAGYFVNQLKTILPKAEKVDIVEINPELPDVATRYFEFREAGLNLKFQDGRVFVRNCKEKYDLIILDVFSESGMNYRFMTGEFFEEVKNILSPEGLLVSNTFGLTDINSENNILFRSLFKTYKSVFKDNIIFPTNYGNYEFYKLLIGLKYNLSDLTNIIVFSSKTELDIKTSKVLEIMDKLGINLDMYVQDFYLGDINTENIKTLSDKYENSPNFTAEKIKNFLRTI